MITSQQDVLNFVDFDYMRSTRLFSIAPSCSSLIFPQSSQLIKGSRSSSSNKARGAHFLLEGISWRKTLQRELAGSFLQSSNSFIKPPPTEGTGTEKLIPSFLVWKQCCRLTICREAPGTHILTFRVTREPSHVKFSQPLVLSLMFVVYCNNSQHLFEPFRTFKCREFCVPHYLFTPGLQLGALVTPES